MTNRLTRRQMLRAIAGLGGAALLSGCGAGIPASTPTRRAGSRLAPSGTAAQTATDILRFAWWTDVGNLTPFQVSTTGPGGAVLLTLVYDTLTWKDERGIIPWLASGWEAAEDGSEYTFRLVEDVSWQDGKPLTADDVKFSFDYYAEHPYRWMPADVVESADVVGSGQVRVRLRRSYAPFLEDIAGSLPVIPRHIWEQVADPVKYSSPDGTTGSGPFRLASHDEAEGSYRLTANVQYWRGRPLVSEFRQLMVPPETRVEIVRKGEADVSLSTDASVRDLLANARPLKVFETAPLSLVRLALNTGRPPLDRKEVRQALVYAVDRERIAEAMTRGPAIRGSSGVVPPETPWHNPSLNQYEHNPERARELLGGRSFTLDLVADAQAREPDLMQPMLQAVGITLNVQRVDAPTRTQLLREGNFQMSLTAHIGTGGDPDYLRRWYTGEEANAFAQGSIFHNEEYTRLGEEQAAALDREKRREIVFRMQEILAEELPTIVLYHRRFYWIYNPGVFTPMQTAGGLMNGIPFPNNKLALIES